MSRAAALFHLLLLAVFVAPVCHAQGGMTGIHRCVSNDGQAIFTDRACADVQAVESVPTTGDPGTGTMHISAVHACARKAEDLLFDVRMALEAQDVNRFASSYLWTGMGTREAYSLMDRLSDFIARPLVDAQLMSSAPQFEPPPPTVIPPLGPSDPFAADSDDELTPPPPPPLPEPDLIRVDQTSAKDDAASATSYFRIVPAAGCLWIRF